MITQNITTNRLPKFRFYMEDDPINPDEIPTGMFEVTCIDMADQETVYINELISYEDAKERGLTPLVNGGYAVPYHISNGVLMQATGQYDMDGAEIYEGDIASYFYEGIEMQEGSEGIKIDRSKPFPKYHVGEVVFKGGYFGIWVNGTPLPIWDSARNITVIGNVCENPELLETPYRP